MIAKFKELQVVKTIKAFENIPTGTIGTILFIHNHELEIAYEVDFIDHLNRFYETIAVPESFLNHYMQNN